MKNTVENSKNLVDRKSKNESTTLVNQNSAVDRQNSSILAQKPNIDINKQNFSIPDLVNLLGISKQAIHKRFVKKEKSAIMTKTGNKTEWIIPFEALKPAEKISVMNKFKSEFQKGEINIENEQINIVNSSENDIKRRSDFEYQLPEKQLNIAIMRRNLINNYVNFLNSQKLKKVKAKAEFEKLYNSGIILPEIYKVIGKTSYKSIERWKVRLLAAEKDYRVLAPKYKLKIGFSIPEEQKRILLSYALHPNQPLISEVVRAAIMKFEMLNLPFVKSANTYRRFLEEWSKENFDKWTFAREGEKALNDKCIPDIKRDYNVIEVGDIIVADGHVLNFEILNPFTGRLKRMTMVAFLDMKSNALLGWDIQPTENIMTISVALYRSILRLGKYPKVIYLDNGKAFRAKYFNGEELENTILPGLFERLGVKVMYAQPYHAQSKIIERFFGTFAELERMMPTYTGISIDKKPPRMNRGEKLHSAIHAKLTKNMTIDLWTAHNAIAVWLDEYMVRPQSGHLNGKSPVELFDNGKGPGIDKRELIFLMMEEKVSKIYKNGIRFLNTYYWHEELYGMKTDGILEVKVKYDLLERDSIYVYTSSGEFICEAKNAESIHPAAGILGNEEDVEKLNEALRRKGLLKKSTTQSAKEFLSEEMYPTIKKQITEAKIIQFEKTDSDEAGTAAKDKKNKKKSMFDDMDEINIKDKNKNTSFWDKAAEG